jgi:hypothetical protein
MDKSRIVRQRARFASIEQSSLQALSQSNPEGVLNNGRNRPLLWQDCAPNIGASIHDHGIVI